MLRCPPSSASLRSWRGATCDRRDWQAGAVTQSPVIASAVSPQGRSVELTEERWRYIQRHVEMSGRQDELLEAIRQSRWRGK